MITTIELKNIRIYAYHGCLKEESLVGSDYRVDLKVQIDNLSKAFMSDELSDTVDYVLLNQIVKEEMSQRSKLLEHVGNRIIKRIFESTRVNSAEVSISKLNPPIGGDVEAVSIRISDKKF